MRASPEHPDQPAWPLDAADPRFGQAAPGQRPTRTLVPSKGPGTSPEDPRVRALRLAIPLLVAAGMLLGVAVLVAGLRSGTSSVEVVGAEPQVRAALSQRPHRVCGAGGQPCAWLSLVDGELLALSTSGPAPEERGRQGVGWCPSSGRFGSDASGSRYDARGRVVAGPAPRGLDRYRVTVTDGLVAVDFLAVSTNLQAGRPFDAVPATGPDCAQLPFDRHADLVLD